jgi:hypothetical protein
MNLILLLDKSIKIQNTKNDNVTEQLPQSRFNSLMNERTTNNTRSENMKENKRKEETEEVIALCLSAGDFDHKC